VKTKVVAQCVRLTCAVCSDLKIPSVPAINLGVIAVITLPAHAVHRVVAEESTTWVLKLVLVVRRATDRECSNSRSSPPTTILHETSLRALFHETSLRSLFIETSLRSLPIQSRVLARKELSCGSLLDETSARQLLDEIAAHG
jgi:hypothetical protein